MINIAIMGANGRMGQALQKIKKQRFNDCFHIVANIDITPNSDNNPPNITDLSQAPDFDLLIDFSHPNASYSAISTMLKRKSAWLLATTGLSKEQQSQIYKLADFLPLLHASNTSIGITLLHNLIKTAASILKDWDTEILEMHHKHKIDAPSGTALALANSIAQAKDIDLETYLTFTHNQNRQPRLDNQIGIASLRGGSLSGTHSVFFLTENESITITHDAQSRDIFAIGALTLAPWLVQQPAGLYNMQDFLNHTIKTKNNHDH